MKTFPLQLEDSYHDNLRKTAFQYNKTIKDFILEAIDEKITKLKQK